MQGHGLDRETKEAILKLAGVEMIQEPDNFHPRCWSWQRGKYIHGHWFPSYKRALKEAMRWWRKQQGEI